MSLFSFTRNPTPFGFFDTDTDFQQEADSSVTFVKFDIEKLNSLEFCNDIGDSVLGDFIESNISCNDLFDVLNTNKNAKHSATNDIANAPIDINKLCIVLFAEIGDNIHPPSPVYNQ